MGRSVSFGRLFLLSVVAPLHLVPAGAAEDFPLQQGPLFTLPENTTVHIRADRCLLTAERDQPQLCNPFNAGVVVRAERDTYDLSEFQSHPLTTSPSGNSPDRVIIIWPLLSSKAAALAAAKEHLRSDAREMHSGQASAPVYPDPSTFEEVLLEYGISTRAVNAYCGGDFQPGLPSNALVLAVTLEQETDVVASVSSAIEKCSGSN
jgi:hypothetical protein